MRMNQFISTTLITLAALAMTTLGGCASSGGSTSAGPNPQTAMVGQYSPAPAVADKPRVGVPPFDVTGPDASGGFNESAADIMTTLAFRSDRFQVIERAQLQQLLDEQGLEGIVKPGELAEPGAVRGVDYLLLGKITNFRVRTQETRHGFSLAQLEFLGGGAGAADTSTKNVEIRTECGVDIRLVDPSSGEIVAAQFGDFEYVDTAESIGVDILGASAESEANLTVGPDDKGKLLRLAIDHALRKMLPDVDEMLIARAPASTADTPATSTTGAKFCTNCGEKLSAGAKFCTSCGTKVPGT